MTVLIDHSRRTKTTKLESRSAPELTELGPNLGACFDFWNSRRKGKPVPSRFDLDPPYEIMHLLPRLCLFDVESIDWRMIGSDFLALMEMKDRTFSDGVACNRLKAFMHQCRDTCTDQTPRLTKFLSGNGADYPNALFLPLSSDTPAISTILVCAELRNAEHDEEAQFAA